MWGLIGPRGSRQAGPLWPFSAVCKVRLVDFVLQVWDKNRLFKNKKNYKYKLKITFDWYTHKEYYSD